MIPFEQYLLFTNYFFFQNLTKKTISNTFLCFPMLGRIPTKSTMQYGAIVDLLIKSRETIETSIVSPQLPFAKHSGMFGLAFVTFCRTFRDVWGNPEHDEKDAKPSSHF